VATGEGIAFVECAGIAIVAIDGADDVAAARRADVLRDGDDDGDDDDDDLPRRLYLVTAAGTIAALAEGLPTEADAVAGVAGAVWLGEPGRLGGRRLAPTSAAPTSASTYVGYVGGVLDSPDPVLLEGSSSKACRFTRRDDGTRLDEGCEP
jgi:hypothetical protein